MTSDERYAADAHLPGRRRPARRAVSDDDPVGEDTVFDVETSTKDNLTRVFFRHDGRYVTGRYEVTYRYPILEYHSGWSTALGRALRELADRMDPR